MSMSKGNMNRMEKMMKKLAEESVPEGETLNFCDVGTIESAKEVSDATKKGLAKTYAVGLLTAGAGAAAGASGTAMRRSTMSYAKGQFDSDQFVAVVTDRNVRIVNARQKSTGFSLRYDRIKGSEDVVLPLAELTLETGELSQASMLGMKWTSIPVTFNMSNGERIAMHFYKEDQWKDLAAALAQP
jgi:hypothetical protein